MKQVIVFPRGQLSKTDKERLTKAGVVAVEADDPAAVKMLLPSSSLVTGDDLLLAALDGINHNQYDDKPGAAMGKSLSQRIKARAAEGGE